MASCSGFNGDCERSNEVGEASKCEMRISRGRIRGRSSLRSRRSNLQNIKPLSSLESCLMAQLYKEHAEMEIVLAPLPSPCTPALRPFVVSDGTPFNNPSLRSKANGAQVISRLSCDSCDVQVRDGKGKSLMKVCPEANEAVFGGIPSLPELLLDEGSVVKSLKRRKDQNRNFRITRRMHSEMQISSQGSTTGSVLFCLGVSVGIISSILANKAEMAKLHDLLKQTENLVQDLHEELEMKDTLTVKELVNEDDVFSYVKEKSADRLKPNEPLIHSDPDILIIDGDEANGAPRAAETVESLSTIEAELEAELERLELNMKKSTLDGTISDVDELDPDLTAEVVLGDLRTDIFSNKFRSDTFSDHNSSSSSTPCSPKQAVSPRELSIRLHQVIQSRLEQRIIELETALEESEKRISQLQSEQQLSCSWRGFSHTDASSYSFSTRDDSPNTVGGSTPVDYYNGACQEHEKINVSSFEKLNGMEYGKLLRRSVNAEAKTPVAKSRMMEQSEKLCADENEEEDEDMTLLIKQIVEKTRQGSPAVLHAHRAMVYLHNNGE